MTCPVWVEVTGPHEGERPDATSSVARAQDMGLLGAGGLEAVTCDSLHWPHITSLQLKTA